VSETYEVWSDPELAYLARQDVRLLAVADALVEAGRTRSGRVRRRSVRVGLVAAAIAMAAILAASAFGLGARLWGLVDGKPVQPRALGSDDWNVLSRINSYKHRLTPKAADNVPIVKSLDKLGFVAITTVAERNGESFYVLRRRDGSKCYADGPTGGFRTARRGHALFSGIECRTGYPFPSRRAPVFDMTAFHASSFSRETGVSGSFVWRLRGFAADPVDKVGVTDVDGTLRVVTDVENNVYDASNLPKFTAKEIVAFDRSGHRVYTMCVKQGGCR
jgi:hypothetical protein